uniref:Uncharacterized protein n=1 Tax=Podoviridae sp. ctlpi2 TaxID=2826574 RepID=A0A8S5MMH2_9CAUD|nr:MAG TPA: protein of unknown function (DUF4094) [Podoviridae sp. ctlpi2]
MRTIITRANRRLALVAMCLACFMAGLYTADLTRAPTPSTPAPVIIIGVPHAEL